MYAKRIREYNAQFGLYKIEGAVDCPITDDNGRQCAVPAWWNGVLAVREINFTGWTKRKTGAHRLNELNTAHIEITSLRVHSDGKCEAQKWHLENQAEVDRLYSQRVCFNI